jgi:hypothetical protein
VHSEPVAVIRVQGHITLIIHVHFILEILTHSRFYGRPLKNQITLYSIILVRLRDKLSNTRTITNCRPFHTQYTSINPTVQRLRPLCHRSKARHET